MGNNHYVYLGSYLKVWLPKEQRISSTGECPLCDNISSDNFCSYCGSVLMHKIIDAPKDAHTIISEIFDDVDRFFCYSDIRYDECLIMPNNSSQGGKVVDESEREVAIPANSFGHNDWQELMRELSDRNIKFRECFGLVNYWM